MSRAPRSLAAVALAAALMLGGCATAPASGPGGPTPGQKADPFEAVNRRIFDFNDRVDRIVLEPVARGYRNIVPQIVRTGIGNVLGNIGDAWSALNQFLQGKGQAGLEMGMRVLTNTVFGLGGLLDPASELGLSRRSEDLGQTLGVWGIGPGPYIVLPFLGPSTARDASAFIVDRQAAPGNLPKASADRLAVTAVELIDKRASLLATGELVNQVALDRYSFVRDAFLARRLDQVFDGNPPLAPMEDDGGDSAPPEAAKAPAPAASKLPARDAAKDAPKEPPKK